MTAPAGLLEDRVAVVLGATGWIGRSVCRRLIEAGARVALVARDETRLNDLARELGAPDRTVVVAADVSSALDVDDARSAALERFGRVDLVVVLAGAITGSAFEDGVPADWADMIDINLRGVLHAAQTFAGPMIQSASEGHVADLVLLGAVTDDERRPRFAVFNAVSAAVSHLGRTLRQEFGPRGVRVHLIQPSFRHSGVESPVPDPRRDRDASAVTPEAIAAVVVLAACLPAQANLAEVVLRPTGVD